MKSHRLPFENRWTNGEHAWHWHCELERLGVSTVRIMFAEHETHRPAQHSVVYDVPSEFVRDWLAKSQTAAPPTADFRRVGNCHAGDGGGGFPANMTSIHRCARSGGFPPIQS
jgi:hypothetical protein